MVVPSISCVVVVLVVVSSLSLLKRRLGRGANASKRRRRWPNESRSIKGGPGSSVRLRPAVGRSVDYLSCFLSLSLSRSPSHERGGSEIAPKEPYRSKRIRVL